LKIALCQIDPTVGDISGNADKIVEFAGRAAERGAQVALFPELSLVGYPPRDLLLKEAFIRDQLRALEGLAKRISGVTAVVGFASRDCPEGMLLHNSAAVIAAGQIVAVGTKRLLPTYDVFDEERYFCPGSTTATFEVAGKRVGVTICEDAWNDRDFWGSRPAWSGKKTYTADPVADAAAEGVSLLLNLSASPYSLGKEPVRREMFAFSARKYGMPIAFVNQVGGNDELIFDGRSLGISAEGRIVAACKAFEEDMTIFDTDAKASAGTLRLDMPEEEEAFKALVVGTRDYARKCGFSKAIIGLSGGIDSSLVAVVAAEALGAANVTGVLMPSMYSSEGSVTDAQALVANLGIRSVTVPIKGIYEAFISELAPPFKDTAPDITEENIQARIRGTILMAMSNKFGGLLLSTGNKSEVSVGYCTLYGDMAGGLDVIGDVLKTFVYRIARWINTQTPVIPENSITKPPSAELRPNQTDQDSLPPYEVLDAILEQYVEEEKAIDEIVALGFDPAVVLRTVRLVDLSEYKRKQAAPVLKITGRAFGFGRRMPIAQRYRQKG
jgi:NAD+ synthase (glutamine-hydrolysing)